MIEPKGYSDPKNVHYTKCYLRIRLYKRMFLAWWSVNEPLGADMPEKETLISVNAKETLNIRQFHKRTPWRDMLFGCAAEIQHTPPWGQHVDWLQVEVMMPDGNWKTKGVLRLIGGEWK